MDFEKLATSIVADLNKVSQSLPNEKLPKEEQIRSCLYAELRKEYDVVCVERTYPAANSSTVEVDLWTRDSTGTSTWIEIKRFWHVSGPGWVHKPDEQLRSWQADLEKLAKVSINENRIFVLVGFLTVDPEATLIQVSDGAIHRLNHFHPQYLRHQSVSRFVWRDSPVKAISVSFWMWESGEAM